MKSVSLFPSTSEPPTDDPRCPVCGSKDFQRHPSRDLQDKDLRRNDEGELIDYGWLGIVIFTCCICGNRWKGARPEKDRVHSEGVAKRLREAAAEKKRLEAIHDKEE